ncbi:MAG: prephenate dehydrogenase/arogenate dehydrogenase family protein [Cyanobacteria bacterium HKST-UBA05]|nr:prephenate dehydrogenase/arogenate dehydrogenase family protein [Cyanobacteria bacterium HKST-UBA05]
MMSLHPATQLFGQVVFIGLGLIGGSMAKRLRYELPQTRILACDKPEVLQLALEEGLIDEGLSSPTQAEVYAENTLVVLATHLNQSYAVMADICKAAPTDLQHPLQMMDLGSTKSTICRLAEQLSVQYDLELDFVGGHPMAGREISGFQNSRSDLFLDKLFMLTPCATTTEGFLNKLVQWLEDLKVRPHVPDVTLHDKTMSLVSHFPQFYAIALGNLLHRNDPETLLHYLGAGLDDQLRLMISPHNMWQDIFLDNKTHLESALEDFITILSEMKAQLAQSQSLQAWFDKSHDVHHIYQRLR